MSRRHRRSKMHGSMAGWLFADLSIVLAIVFMTSIQSTDQAASSIATTTTTSSTTSTTTTTTTTTTTAPTTIPSVPDTGVPLACNGVVPKPVEVLIPRAESQPSMQVFKQIATLLDQNYPDSNFSMVIIISGTGGDRSEQASKSARKSAQAIGETLKAFDRFVNEKYVEPNYTADLELGEAKIKIFPLVCE